MNKNYSKAVSSIVFAVMISAFPYCAFAQSISLTSEKTSYQINENISVALTLGTGNNSINTVQGTIQIPSDFFEISNITTGSSFLSLWPERPTAHDGGTVTFTGGIPGGFAGSGGNILNISLKAKKSGKASITVENATVLLNDGRATELKDIKFMPLALNISAQVKKEAAKPIVDTVPPEPFTPVISQNPSVSNNKYFVYFFAKDPGSGISYYEVREGYVILPIFGPLFLTQWQKTENPPYILNLQHWWSKVYVRAYDNAGNYRDESVLKPLDKEGTIILYALLIILLILIAIILLIFIKKFRKNK